MTRSPVNIWVKASATSFWMTANTGCFAWKITSNKWPLLFSFQICDSNEQERGSLLWRQCYLHLNTGKSCLSLGLRSGRRRSRELITEGDLFSFIWGASQGALRKGERSANACQVVKMSVSFPKASVLLEGVDAASGCWQNHSGSRALNFTLADQCLLQWWGCFSSWKGAAFTAQKVRLFPQIPAGSPRAIYLLKWWRALPLSPWDSVFHILSFKSGKGSVLFSFFFFFWLKALDQSSGLCRPEAVSGPWPWLHSEVFEETSHGVWPECFCLLLLFSRSVVSDALRPCGLQHARPPCPSPAPGAYSNSCPLSWWCHPAISSSVVPFSSCPQFCTKFKPGHLPVALTLDFISRFLSRSQVCAILVFADARMALGFHFRGNSSPLCSCLWVLPLALLLRLWLSAHSSLTQSWCCELPQGKSYPLKFSGLLSCMCRITASDFPLLKPALQA